MNSRNCFRGPRRDLLRRRLLASSALLLVVVLTACQTEPTQPQVSRDRSDERIAAPELTRGMSAEEVLAAVGEPIERIRIDDPRIPDGEEWIYRHSTWLHAGMTAADSEEIPYVDPITQEMKYAPRAVMVPENHRVIRTYHLFIIDGRLAGWKVESRDQRQLG